MHERTISERNTPRSPRGARPIASAPRDSNVRRHVRSAPEHAASATTRLPSTRATIQARIAAAARGARYAGRSDLTLVPRQREGMECSVLHAYDHRSRRREMVAVSSWIASTICQQSVGMSSRREDLGRSSSRARQTSQATPRSRARARMSMPRHLSHLAYTKSFRSIVISHHRLRVNGGRTYDRTKTLLKNGSIATQRIIRW